MARKASISSISTSGLEHSLEHSTLSVKGVLRKTGSSEFETLEFLFSSSSSFSLKRGFMLLELKLSSNSKRG
ncbi:hypothetical protein Tco_0463836, partial [Tanacetum coccineum]